MQRLQNAIGNGAGIAMQRLQCRDFKMQLAMAHRLKCRDYNAETTKCSRQWRKDYKTRSRCPRHTLNIHPSYKNKSGKKHAGSEDHSPHYK